MNRTKKRASSFSLTLMVHALKLEHLYDGSAAPVHLYNVLAQLLVI
jgi:hypothetical protein